MSEVSQIVGQVLAQDDLALRTQIAISVFKESLKSQEAVLKLIQETLGVGTQVDITA